MLNWVELGSRYLARHKIPEAKAHAEILLAHVLGIKRKEVYLNRRVSKKYFQSLQERAVKKKPLAYILGSQDFMGLSFKVVEKITLIPRPETESLVEFVLKKIRENFPKKSPLQILDIGTGTGCVGLSLWHFLKADYELSLVLADSSKKALSVARHNARKIGIAPNFSLSMWPLRRQSFHVIVSNPPYIKDKEFKKLPAEIRLWEPKVALVGGGDGLTLIREIIQGACEHLHSNGFLALEIDSWQKTQVRDLLVKNSYKDVEIAKDLEGRDRVIYGRL